MTNNVRQALKDAEDTINKLNEAFVESQESIISELNYIINELICGRQEETFVALRDLRDELTVDVIIARGGTTGEKLDKLISIGCREYVENEQKRELNTTTGNENV